MKKLFVLFLCLFATDSHSSGIGNVSSAPCDNATLDKYTGTANVEINWEPNTIGLKWFNGEEQVSGQNSCVYDGTITVPPQPTKPGYTFNGWKIPKYDFSTIPTDVNGMNRWAIGWEDNANYCWYETNANSAWNVNCNSDSTYDELQTHEWKVRFNHGDIYGISRCSTTSGTYAQPDVPTIDSGQYCWCKATGYKPSGSNVINGSLFSLSWVFNIERASVVDCAKFCATRCTDYVKHHSAFRTALFAPAGN